MTEYPIPVLAAVLKSFFRDLPEPVLTFDLYDDFVRAAGRFYRKKGGITRASLNF